MIYKYSCLVVIYGVVTLLADLAIAQTNSNAGGSYLSAALTNAVAIQNYDCLVTTESARTLPRGEGKNDAGLFEEKIERIICDYARKSVFYASKQRFSAIDPKKVGKFKVKLPFTTTSYFSYVDGVTYPANGKSATLGEFVRRNRIPAMEFACLNGHPYHFSESSREEHVTAQLKAFDSIDANLQPDGMICCTSWGPNKTYSHLVFINPSSLLPKRFVRKTMVGDESIVTLEKRYIFETKKDISLLAECNFEAAATQNDPYGSVGTTFVRWLQMNEKELVIPPAPAEYSDTFTEFLLDAKQIKERTK